MVSGSAAPGRLGQLVAVLTPSHERLNWAVASTLFFYRLEAAGYPSGGKLIRFL